MGGGGAGTGSGLAGEPSSSALTSLARYRRWPPSVRTELSFPAFAHRVTVLGSTRNIAATSAGVSSGSESFTSAVITLSVVTRWGGSNPFAPFALIDRWVPLLRNL